MEASYRSPRAAPPEWRGNEIRRIGLPEGFSAAEASRTDMLFKVACKPLTRYFAITAGRLEADN
jgi:hypothetical protein